MTSPSESTVIEQAVTAAAEAMENEAVLWLGRDLGTLHRNYIAQAALVAAVPLILAALADEIDSRSDDLASVPVAQAGMRQASVVVRSAAGRWGSDE